MTGRRMQYASLVRQMSEKCTDALLDSLDIDALEQYLVVLERYYASFIDDQAALMESAQEQEQNAAAALMVDIDLLREGARARINERLVRRVAARNSQQVPAAIVRRERNQFDAAALGTFSGDATKWAAFRERYTRMVHTNDELDSIAKFKLLMNALEGRARIVSAQWYPDASQYSQAWSHLCEYYDDPEVQVQMLMDELMRLPQIRVQDEIRLRATREFIEFMMSQLRALKKDLQYWTSVIKFAHFAECSTKG